MEAVPEGSLVKQQFTEVCAGLGEPRKGGAVPRGWPQRVATPPFNPRSTGAKRKGSFRNLGKVIAMKELPGRSCGL